MIIVEQMLLDMKKNFKGLGFRRRNKTRNVWRQRPIGEEAANEASEAGTTTALDLKEASFGRSQML